MGKHQRARIEQEKRKEQTRRTVIRGGVAALILVAAGLSVHAKTGEKGHTRIPKDIAALVHDSAASNGNNRLNNLLGHSYHEADARQIGKTHVTIAEIGDPERMDYQKILDVYKMLNHPHF